MKNKKTEIQVCKHVQLEGVAYYDENKFFMFTPDDPMPERVTRFRKTGVAQQMSDGTFDFVVKPRLRANSTLIKKLAHGRTSETKDGAIQLTLKVFCYEGINICEAIRKETDEACEAIMQHQLKR